eukprot:9492034-Pyramimonas_sp.AAC.1
MFVPVVPPIPLQAVITIPLRSHSGAVWFSRPPRTPPTASLSSSSRMPSQGSAVPSSRPSYGS